MRVIGEQERRFMRKSKVKYTDESIGRVKVVTDFLPKPDELIMKEETVKVTLLLTKESVDFFKKEAEEHHTQYQKMIRRLIDMYAYNYNKAHKGHRYV